SNCLPAYRTAVSLSDAAISDSGGSAQESPEQILQRAVALHQSGAPEKAIPLYRQFLQMAVALNPNLPDVYWPIKRWATRRQRGRTSSRKLPTPTISVRT